MKKQILILLGLTATLAVAAIDLKQCRIITSEKDAPLVQKMATVLSEDILRVTDVQPRIGHQAGKGATVILATVGHAAELAPDVDVSGLRDTWERYSITTRGQRLIIVGSDARGLAYGVLHVSQQIGVSPWYWFADVPVVHKATLDYKENFVSSGPSIKYRGIFINDEDWGLKTWAANNFEKDLGDIGPKTYDKVCELILRLRGNMLAPAMHDCTGAFYSHPESQRVAAEWGIMITTSHCEPLLFNNAAKSEWDKAKDGEWNYLTNKQTIWQKLDNRIRETAQYDNIYTMGMRGLHDEAMKGSTDPKVRARTLEAVFADQREILTRHKQKAATEIPQIFVPYKETLDIYDAGLRVPDDITIVWPDDNYGYMKRVSNEEEQQRTGGAGVYYHLSYLGTPHDNLWIATTAPMLMYEELKKAYDAGARRYWLLNVGDIKPMEIEMQQFFDMAWSLQDFNYDNANRYQAQWLATVFGNHYMPHSDLQVRENLTPKLQQILDTYYRLAWQRKPEFMGYELEWDNDENSRLHDSNLTQAERRQRLADYQAISDAVDAIEKQLPPTLRPSFFEMLGYPVMSAYQMNRKFLMAQQNHETGSAEAAQQSRAANDSILALMARYNTLLDGKWNQMMSQIPPGYVAKYHLMPELVSSPTKAYQLPKSQQRTRFANKIDLSKVKTDGTFRLLEGIGCDWIALQMGQPLDSPQIPGSLSSQHIDIPFECSQDGDTLLSLCISVVPFWPVMQGRSNRFGVSIDGCKPVVCENLFTEWSYPWKLQVLENRKDFVLSLPIDRTKKRHLLTLVIGDPGQMVQEISVNSF